MDGLCLIVSGGEYSPLPLELEPPAFVIACDRGWRWAERLGLRPDLVVGDFDSAPPPEELPVERHPTRKDDTDTMLALRRAIELGWRELAVCCALGGRFDHAFANVQAAAWAVRRGGRVRLLGKGTEILVFGGGVERFPRREGWSLSLFSLSDRCDGVTVTGTKYACEDVLLTGDFPLGVSNVWASEEAEVRVSNGVLAVVQCRLRPGEHI